MSLMIFHETFFRHHLETFFIHHVNILKAVLTHERKLKLVKNYIRFSAEIVSKSKNINTFTEEILN